MISLTLVKVQDQQQIDLVKKFTAKKTFQD